jgi:hypothetical protein
MPSRSKAKNPPAVDSASDVPIRRYQLGSLTISVDSFGIRRWRARYREDQILPKETIPLKGDKVLPDGTVLRRVARNREIGSLKEFPTKRLAERELERIVEVANQNGRA